MRNPVGQQFDGNIRPLGRNGQMIAGVTAAGVGVGDGSDFFDEQLRFVLSPLRGGSAMQEVLEDMAESGTEMLALVDGAGGYV